MVSPTILIIYSILLILQIIHIFEEIAMEAYTISRIGSLKKYLLISSLIMTVYITSFLLLALHLFVGIIFGLFCSTVALVNGIVHTLGLVKKVDKKGTLASGAYSSIPLGILGIINIILLVLYLVQNQL
jgi:hypothetical protein